MPSQFVMIKKSQKSGLPYQAFRHAAEPYPARQPVWDQLGTGTGRAQKQIDTRVGPHVQRWKASSQLREMGALGIISLPLQHTGTQHVSSERTGFVGRARIHDFPKHSADTDSALDTDSAPDTDSATAPRRWRNWSSERLSRSPKIWWGSTEIIYINKTFSTVTEMCKSLRR